MKRLLIALLMVLGLVGCMGHQKRAVETPSKPSEITEIEAMRKAGSVTVALVHEDGVADVSVYCTGVWISKDEILTAAHCMYGLAHHIGQQLSGEDEDEIQVDPYKMPIHYTTEKENLGVDKEPAAMHLGKLLAISTKNDLAVIKVYSQGLVEHAVAELADSMPEVGESVICVGHPQGMYWTYVHGSVAAYRDGMPGPGPGKEIKLIQVQAPIWFGNSGGGLFDKRGRLIGISSFITKAPDTGMYVHRDVIKEWVK